MASSRYRALGTGEVNHALDLFTVEAVVPLDDFINAGAGLEVLEDG